MNLENRSDGQPEVHGRGHEDAVGGDHRVEDALDVVLLLAHAGDEGAVLLLAADVAGLARLDVQVAQADDLVLALAGIGGVELLERRLEHDAAVAVVAGAAVEPQEPHRHASRSSPCTPARRGRRAEGNRHARSRVRERNPTRRLPRTRPPMAAQAWCRRWDSNPHALSGHPILSRARLPVPPHRHDARPIRDPYRDTRERDRGRRAGLRGPCPSAGAPRAARQRDQYCEAKVVVHICGPMPLLMA